MQERLEKITKVIYREWKERTAAKGRNHPDEETLACFIEDKLSLKEKESLEKHLVNCNFCAEYVSAQFNIQPHLSLDVPAQLLEKIDKLVLNDARESLFEILVRFKEKILEVLQTNGDVLVGQELVPAPVLRSRKINEFKEEVSILKDLKDLRLLARIQSRNAKTFNLTVIAKDRISQKIPKNIRITLTRDEIELESHITDSGSVYFENIQPGEYTVEVSKAGEKIALVDLKVKP